MLDVQVVIRRRRAFDLAALEALAAEVLAVDGYPPRVPDDLARFVAAPSALAAFVADGDGKVVGHVCLSPSGSPEVMAMARDALDAAPEQLCVVARLFVAPGHRRAGIAGHLLGAALDEARVLGRRPVLDVATHLETAVALYERLGWRRVGTVTVDMGARPPLDEHVYLAPTGEPGVGPGDR
jgi:GNAT superfamily N-acetyltransferase